jgi:glycosyltransferase involved in cell wall biosynthesis
MTRSFYIVTPSLNQLAMLKLCMASVADQSGVRIHHHVQDAASSDGTGAFLEQYKREHDASARQDGHYTFSYECAPDSGMYDAINRGWTRSRGAYDIYAYLNCDEQYLTGSLSMVAERFERHPAAAVVFGNVLVIGPDGTLICRRNVVAPSKYLVLTGHLPIYTAATFLTAEVLFSHRLFFDDSWKVIGDAEWMLRLFERRLNFHVLNKYLTTFVYNRTNLSSSPEAEKETERLRIRASGCVKYLAKPLKLVHWFKKAIAGAYFPQTVRYDIYLPKQSRRTHFEVRRANNLWLERFTGPE